LPLNGCGNSPLSAPALEIKIFFAVRSAGGTGAPPAKGSSWALAATVNKSVVHTNRENRIRATANIASSAHGKIMDAASVEKTRRRREWFRQRAATI
jgi:hypothetical protein